MATNNRALKGGADNESDARVNNNAEYFFLLFLDSRELNFTL